MRDLLRSIGEAADCKQVDTPHHKDTLRKDDFEKDLSSKFFFFIIGIIVSFFFKI